MNVGVGGKTSNTSYIHPSLLTFRLSLLPLASQGQQHFQAISWKQLMQRQQKNILYGLVHVSNCTSVLSRPVWKPKGSWLQWLLVVPITVTLLQAQTQACCKQQWFCSYSNCATQLWSICMPEPWLSSHQNQITRARRMWMEFTINIIILLPYISGMFST